MREAYEDHDVRVLVRHYLERGGAWKLSPDEPQRLVRGARMCVNGLMWSREEEDAIVMECESETSVGRYVWHQGDGEGGRVEAPCVWSSRELSRGLVWVEEAGVEGARGGVYLVCILGEVFVGRLRRRMHVLGARQELCTRAEREELAECCAREDEWLRGELWQQETPWGEMVSVGELVRHVPLWSVRHERERVYGVLLSWREGVSREKREVMWDQFEERCEHVEGLLANGDRGAFVRELRAHLEAAGALWTWVGGDEAIARLARVDEGARGEVARELHEGCSEGEVRRWLIDGEVWWV